jgi:hypothetical protein
LIFILSREDKSFFIAPQTFFEPFFPKNKRGFAPKVDLADVIQCIIYKLKTDVQKVCCHKNLGNRKNKKYKGLVLEKFVKAASPPPAYSFDSP